LQKGEKTMKKEFYTIRSLGGMLVGTMYGWKEAKKMAIDFVVMHDRPAYIYDENNKLVAIQHP
jgi:hypothetical protein